MNLTKQQQRFIDRARAAAEYHVAANELNDDRKLEDFEVRGCAGNNVQVNVSLRSEKWYVSDIFFSVIVGVRGGLKYAYLNEYNKTKEKKAAVTGIQQFINNEYWSMRRAEREALQAKQQEA